MSSDEPAHLGFRLRGRDKEIFQHLKSKGMKPGNIFRLGMVTAMERLKDLDPKETSDVWEKIAKQSILSD